MQFVRIACLVLCTVISTLACGADDARQEILAAYAFDPSKMTREQMVERATALDQFWNKVRGNPERYVATLREEIQKPSASPVLACDCSTLLLNLSKDVNDHPIILGGLKRCDLYEMQQTGFFFSVHRLASLGVDVSDTALRVLGRTPFAAYAVPKHPPLGQDFALIYMLAPLDDKLYLDKALRLLDTRISEEAQASLLKLIWYTVSEVGDRTTERVAKDAKRPASVREVAKQLLQATASSKRDLTPGEKKKVHGVTAVKENATYAEMKAARRERMKVVSPDALYAFDAISFLMRRQPR